MHNENSGYPSEKAAGSFAGQLTLSMRLYVLLSFLLVSVVARAQTPDPTFGTDGHALLTATTGDAYATCMALQPDGKIVVGGVAYAGITASAMRCLPRRTRRPKAMFSSTVRWRNKA